MKTCVFVLCLTAAVLLAGCRGVQAAPANGMAASGEATAAAAPITPAQAQEIALADAGFTVDQVTRLHTEPDFDGGRREYDVEFRADRWEYDYEIDADTGKILSTSREWDN